jgi:hypothetical protein
MLQLALWLLLSPSPTSCAQEPAVRVPEPAEVDAAVARLEQAFGKGDGPARIEAMEAAREVLDTRVIAWFDRGLKDTDADVARSAVLNLRYMPHPEALELLHKTYKRDKKLRKDPEGFALLLKAIGQHKSTESIAILTDDAFGATDARVVAARILGLGNIRDARSVEALFSLMRSAGRQRVQNHMPTFRLALMVLTGADEGENQDEWMRWWNDHKQTLVVTPEPPKLPQRMQRQWDYHWGNERQRAREKQRGERGNDPEGAPGGPGGR